MLIFANLQLLIMATSAAPLSQPTPCKEFGELGSPSSVANNLSQLPREIRLSLLSRPGGIADAGEPFQETDSTISTTLPQSIFLFGTLIKGEWFITFENNGHGGIQTIGYVYQTDSITGAKSFSFFPPHRLVGPPCIAIKAMLQRVTS